MQLNMALGILDVRPPFLDRISYALVSLHARVSKSTTTLDYYARITKMHSIFNIQSNYDLAFEILIDS